MGRLSGGLLAVLLLLATAASAQPNAPAANDLSAANGTNISEPVAPFSDTTPPAWDSQQQSVGQLPESQTVLLSVHIADDVNLSEAILSTNETGDFVNWTDRYASPVTPNSNSSWVLFPWRNDGVQAGRSIGWKIWFEDGSGNWNATDTLAFQVVSPPPRTGAHNSTFNICAVPGSFCDFTGATAIQDAINFAAPGSTLNVSEGTYSPFTVTKPGLSIVGVDPSVQVDGGGGSVAVNVLSGSDYTNISNFTIVNSQVGVQISGYGLVINDTTITNLVGPRYGLIVTSGQNNLLRNLTLSNFNIGVYSYNSFNTNLSDSVLGPSGSNSGSIVGALIQSSTANVVTNNSIGNLYGSGTGSATAIAVQSSNDDQITQDGVQNLYGGSAGGACSYYTPINKGGSSTGISLSYGRNNTIANNTLANIQAGTGSSNGCLNLQPDGPGGDSFGLYVAGTSQVSLSSNKLAAIVGGTGGVGPAPPYNFGDGGQSTGIFVTGSSWVNLTNNSVQNIFGGNGGSGYVALVSSGAGGTSSGVAIQTSSNVSLGSTQVSNVVGGAPGTAFYTKWNIWDSFSDGVAGSASNGLVLGSASNVTLHTVNITGVQGGTGGDGNANGGPGGLAYGIISAGVSNLSITAINISTVLGGSGGLSKGASSQIYEGDGGSSSGLHLQNSNVSAESVTLAEVVGGDGGSSSILLGSIVYGIGGKGGDAQAMSLDGSPVTAVNLTLGSVRGGKGSSLSGGGYYGRYPIAGLGGNAVGIRLSSAMNSSIANFSLLEARGGDSGQATGLGESQQGGGGTGIQISSSPNITLANGELFSIAGGSAGSAPGAGGYAGGATGVSVSSSDNSSITGIEVKSVAGGNGGAASLGGPGGAAVGITSDSRISVTNSTVANVTAGVNPPTTNSIASQLLGLRLAGADATGVSLSAQGSIVQNVIVMNMTAGAGTSSTGTTSVQRGGDGGRSVGIFVTGNNTTVLESNISDLFGGDGGDTMTPLSVGGSLPMSIGGSGGGASALLLSGTANASVDRVAASGAVGGRNGTGEIVDIQLATVSSGSNGTSIGISMVGSANASIMNSTAARSAVGISLNSSPGNRVTNDTVAWADIGIAVTSSQFNNVRNNTAVNNAFGINLSRSDDNIVTNNTLQNNSENGQTGAGILLSDSNSNDVLGNNASLNFHGIELVNSSFNSVRFNNASDNTGNGIQDGVNNVGDGIFLLDSNNNGEISGNIVLDNNAYGIHSKGSSGNTLDTTLNRIILNGLLGVYAEASTSVNNTYGIEASNNRLGGARFRGDVNTVLLHSVLRSNPVNLLLSNSTNFTMVDSVLSNSTNLDISMNNSSMTVINTTFNPLLVGVGGDSLLSVRWRVNIRVVDSNGTPLEGASVAVSDRFGVEAFNGTSGPDGSVPQLVLEEFQQNATAMTVETPYAITAKKGGLFGLVNITVDRGQNVTVVAVLDTTPPVTTVNLIGISGNANWFLSSVQVVLNATDDATGVASTQFQVDNGAFADYTGPFTVSRDGIHTMEFFSTDGSGNKEATKHVVFKIDKTPPATAANLTGTLGNAGWFLGNAQVALSATDAISGVARIQFQLDNGTVTNYTGPFTIAQEGVHTVVFFSTDVAGNVEPAKSQTVKVDRTPPTTTASLAGLAGNAGWFRSDVQVTLAASDATSGISLTEFQLDNGTLANYTGPFNLTGEGVHTVEFFSTDVAGNVEATKTAVIKIDTTPPQVTILSPADGSVFFPNQSVVLLFSAFDNTSGLAGATATLDGLPVLNGSTIQLRTLSTGLHTLSVLAQDVAGNVGVVNSTFRVKPIPASIDIDPNTLNVKSDGRFITAYIEFPLGFSVGDIDVSTVKLNGVVPAQPSPTAIGDYNNDGIPDLMVKFDRAAVVALVSPPSATLTVGGQLSNGITKFSGSDTIRVISSGDASTDPNASLNASQPAPAPTPGSNGTGRGAGSSGGSSNPPAHAPLSAPTSTPGHEPTPAPTTAPAPSNGSVNVSSGDGSNNSSNGDGRSAGSSGSSNPPAHVPLAVSMSTPNSSAPAPTPTSAPALAPAPAPTPLPDHGGGNNASGDGGAVSGSQPATSSPAAQTPTQTQGATPAPAAGGGSGNPASGESGAQPTPAPTPAATPTPTPTPVHAPQTTPTPAPTPPPNSGTGNGSGDDGGNNRKGK